MSGSCFAEQVVYVALEKIGGVLVVVTESLDGIATIGKIGLSSGVVVLVSSNVSKKSVGTDQETDSALVVVTELTQISKINHSGSKNFCSYIDETSTVSLSLVVINFIVVTVSYQSLKSKGRDTYLMATSLSADDDIAKKSGTHSIREFVHEEEGCKHYKKQV